MPPNNRQIECPLPLPTNCSIHSKCNTEHYFCRVSTNSPFRGSVQVLWVCVISLDNRWREFSYWLINCYCYKVSIVSPFWWSVHRLWVWLCWFSLPQVAWFPVQTYSISLHVLQSEHCLTFLMICSHVVSVILLGVSTTGGMISCTDLFNIIITKWELSHLFDDLLTSCECDFAGSLYHRWHDFLYRLLHCQLDKLFQLRVTFGTMAPETNLQTSFKLFYPHTLTCICGCIFHKIYHYLGIDS